MKRLNESVAAARGNPASVVAARLGRPPLDSVAAGRGNNAHVLAARVDQEPLCDPAAPRDVVHRASSSQPFNIIVYNGQTTVPTSASAASAPLDSAELPIHPPGDINQRLSFPVDRDTRPPSGAPSSATLSDSKARRSRRRTLYTSRKANASSHAPPSSTPAAPAPGAAHDAQSPSPVPAGAPDLLPPSTGASLQQAAAPPSAPADERVSALTAEILRL